MRSQPHPQPASAMQLSVVQPGKALRLALLGGIMLLSSTLLSKCFSDKPPRDGLHSAYAHCSDWHLYTHSNDLLSLLAAVSSNQQHDQQAKWPTIVPHNWQSQLLPCQWDASLCCAPTHCLNSVGSGMTEMTSTALCILCSSQCRPVGA